MPRLTARLERRSFPSRIYGHNVGSNEFLLGLYPV